MGAKNVLLAQNDAELLSYIINVTPALKENIDLPTQGEDIKAIGSIIINNDRYRNAFINTVNLIGATIIKRNGWDNPWDFTTRGELNYGQQLREIVNDLCNVYDYNENLTNELRFTQSVVPNVFQYIHEINFQKFYETTTSDNQLRMAFETGDLFSYIEDAISMLYESYKYDCYIIDKYMLCRRLLDGTVSNYVIENFATKSTREVVSEMKNVSNKMTFRSPNYNPAGIRRATSFDDQILIANTDFDAKLTTEVLATSFFRNDADMKIRLALIDGFANHDTARLDEVLGDQYVSFTETDLAILAKVPAVIISREWFMDYYYTLDNASETKKTEFFNPTTLKNNHFLHAWRIFSTSPFENACAMITDTPAVSAVAVSPAEATITAGQKLHLTATVTATNLANKAVVWSITTGADKGATVDQNGIVTIPADFDTTQSGEDVEPNLVVVATSVFNGEVSGQAEITVV